MKLEIRHSTTYTYDHPVELNPHYLNFRPLERPHIKIEEFNLDITPKPAQIYERLDAENNYYHQILMEEVSIKKLNIEVLIRLSIDGFNPFDFLLDPVIAPSQEEFYYGNKHSEYLKIYMDHWNYSDISEFIHELIEQSEDKMVPFLSLLVQAIYDNWTHEKRTYDRSLNAQHCYKSKKGSCKDLAWMLMVMLRGVGLATRFVSGYAYNPLLEFGHELHAWVEVLLPGAGWIGLDPSSGLFTNEYYVPVATSFNPSLTMPVDGTYIGDDGSTLETTVDISIIED